MTQQIINIGATPNDGNGDPLRTAFGKINNNFSELFQTTLPSGPDGSVQYRAANDVTSVAWGNNLYLAIGRVNRVYISTDGTNWVAQTGPGVTLTSAVWDGAKWVAVGDGGTVWTSANAISWTPRATGITANLLSIALGTGGALCAVGEAGEIITSPDGINWTGRSSGVATTLRGVTWSTPLGAWVAVGDAGAITVSANAGVTWVVGTSGVLTNLNAVTAAGARVVAVGDGGLILNSPDALLWTIDTSGTVQNLRGVAAVTISTTTTAFACGDGGIILSTVGPTFNGWESTTYPSPTTKNLLNATAGNDQVFMAGASGVIVRFDLGALELDEIPGGLSGSAKFVFTPQSNLLTLDSNFVPGTNNAWSLGNNTNRWQTVWTDGNAGVVVGDVVLRGGGNTLTLHQLGNVSNLSNLVVNSITVSGDATYANLAVTGNLTVAGNTQLSNVTANVVAANTANIANFTSANSNFAGNVAIGGNLLLNGNLQSNGGAQFTGNVAGNYILGNGAFLTGLPPQGGGAVGPFGAIQWSNGAGNNLSSPNLYWDNATRTLHSDNFSGNFLGQLVGNVLGNVTGNLAGNVTGDVTGNLTGNATLYWSNVQNLNAANTANIGTLNVSNSANIAGNLAVAGNISADGFTVANLGIGNATVAGNLTVVGNTRLGNANIEYIESNLANIVELEVYHSNILLANIDALTGNAANIIQIESDDITANKVTANWGNFVNLNAQLAVFTTANAVTFNGNSNANLVTAGNIQVYDDVIANNYTANGNFYGNFVGNITSNLLTVDTIVANTANIGNVNANLVNANVVTANTFVGNLQGNVQGNIVGATAVFTTSVTAPAISATTFTGNVVGNLTGNVVGNITGTRGTFTGNVSVGGNLNVTGQTVTGTLTAGTTVLGQTNVSTLTAGGNITTLGNVNAGNLVAANYLSGQLTTGPQPGITEVGTLNDLNVLGNGIFGGNLRSNNLTVLANSQMGNAVITGNLVVQGNTTYTNTNSLIVESPIIEQGGGPNGTPPVLNDGKDRGLLQHYYTTQPVDAFMGFQNSTGNFILASNVTDVNDVMTVNTWGNLQIDTLFANRVVSNRANIGNLAAGNIAANKVTANYFTGDGSNLSGLPVQNLTAGSNITLVNNSGNWTINAALSSPAAGGLAGEIQFSDANGNFDASPNLIYTVASSNLDLIGNMIATKFWGNLEGNVTGNVTGNVQGNVVGNVQGNVSGNLTGNVSGNIAGATANFTGNVTANWFIGNNANIGNIAGTLTTAAQPNITSVGQLTNLNVLGDIQSGNVWANSGTVGASLLTGTLTTAAQPNITSVGLLTTLSVFGNLDAGNIEGGNLIEANYLQGTITANSAAQPNITSLGNLTGLTVTGSSNLANVTAGNVTVTSNLAAANFRVNTLANISNLVVTANSDLGNIRIEGSNITDRGVGNLHTFTITSIDAPIVIRSPSSTIANANAQSLTLTTGTAVGDARGGNLNLRTGDGATANSGNINIRGGNGVVAGTVGGSINIIAGETIGDPNTITGSNVYIQSGNTVNEDGGAIVIQGANATGPLLFGGNIYITPGEGDIANNANYTGYLYLANLRWPIADGNNYELITTDGNGILSFSNISNIPGVNFGFSNIDANGNILLSNVSPNIALRAGNVAVISNVPTGNVQTVGIKGIPATSNTQPGVIELRVTPTGVYIDNPFGANIDFSTTGNNLINDFESLEGAEIGTNWTWDMSKNPLAGLQRFDLGSLT